MRAFLSFIALTAAVVTSGCVNKAPGAALCSSQSACAEGSVCVVGRCRLPTTSVVGSIDHRRLVLYPEASAAVSADGVGAGKTLPAVVVLGRGSTSVYLRFAVPVDKPNDVVAAVLALEPERDAFVSAQSIPIHAAQILDEWTEETVINGRVPRVGVPERAGFIGGAFSGSLKLDVTHIVKRWAERKEDEHGIAVIADDSDAYGAPVSLGVTDGKGPRLEVYLR